MNNTPGGYPKYGTLTNYKARVRSRLDAEILKLKFLVSNFITCLVRISTVVKTQF